MNEYNEKLCNERHEEIKEDRERSRQMEMAVLKLTTIVEGLVKRELWTKVLIIAVVVMACCYGFLIIGPEAMHKIIGK